MYDDGRGGALLRLEGITKSFNGTPVLKGINLDVHKGEFITLLGASGCGKTTTIRVIAGFEEPDSGRVWLDGRDVTGLEPNHRDVNTVFQNYALFPHMNVEANVAYSLKIRRLPKAQTRDEVTRALGVVRLEGFEKRMPHELSGGQRQRVAIARAIVNNPKVLLLDEPLGALDLQLRRQMQIELKRLQKLLDIAFIYITHDQEEALNMSDRIAVMREGVFEQVGSASDVYGRPETDYVARFVGNANVLDGLLPDGSTSRGVLTAVRSEHIILTPVEKGTVSEINGGAGGLWGDRSAGGINISGNASGVKGTGNIGNASGAGGTGNAWGNNDAGNGGVYATVSDKTFSGGMLRVSATMDSGGEVVASRHGIDSELTVGQRVSVSWDPANAVIVNRN